MDELNMKQHGAMTPYLLAIAVLLLWAATTLTYKWGQESKEIVSLVKECTKQNGDWQYNNYIEPSLGKKLTCKVNGVTK